MALDYLPMGDSTPQGRFRRIATRFCQPGQATKLGRGGGLFIRAEVVFLHGVTEHDPHQRNHEADVSCVQPVEDMHDVASNEERAAECGRPTGESRHEFLEHTPTMDRALPPVTLRADTATCVFQSCGAKKLPLSVGGPRCRP